MCRSHPLRPFFFLVSSHKFVQSLGCYFWISNYTLFMQSFLKLLSAVFPTCVIPFSASQLFVIVYVCVLRNLTSCRLKNSPGLFFIDTNSTSIGIALCLIDSTICDCLQCSITPTALSALGPLARVACDLVCCLLALLQIPLDDHGRRAMVAERWAPIQWTLDPFADLSERLRLVVESTSSLLAARSLPLNGRIRSSGFSDN